MADLTYQAVRELLHYDPDTGELTWRSRDSRWFGTEGGYKSWNSRYAGKPAGHYITKPDGYRYHRVKLLGRLYFAGPLVWFYMTGAWPKGEVDHIDRDPWNQAWNNLRDVTAAENSRNRSAQTRRKGSGCTGVHFNRQIGSWQAYVKCNGKLMHLGLHSTLLDAVAARKRAEREFGFSIGHGQPRPERSENHGR